MIWIAVTVTISVLFICECIATCVKNKYKYQNACCCKTCPYRDVCWEVCENDR